MELGLSQKNAIVFAASRGFGKAIALTLAAEGCRVAICSRNEANIQAAAGEIRQQTAGEVFSAVVDLEHKDQIDGGKLHVIM